MLGLTQRQLAAELGVVVESIVHWEKGKTQPPIARIPALVAFLGYDPFPAPETLAEQLLAKRRAMGWSIQQAAEKLGVDPATWSKWERGQAILIPTHRAAVVRLCGARE